MKTFSYLIYLISFLISCVFDLESSAYFLTEYDKYIRKINKFLELLIILMLLTERLFMRETELTALKHSNDRCISYNFVIESEHVMIMSEYNKIKFMTK